MGITPVASLQGMAGRAAGKRTTGVAMEYEEPQVVDYGTLTDLTAGQMDGDFTDRDFPVNTPKRDLTFS
jgi:hypothetical protein